MAERSRGPDGWRRLGNDFAVFILFGLGVDGVFQFENPLINERFAVALDLGVVGLLVFEPGGTPFFGALLRELRVDELGMIY